MLQMNDNDKLYMNYGIWYWMMTWLMMLLIMLYVHDGLLVNVDLFG